MKGVKERSSVIVIGAGLSGLAVADALRRRGASVRVFDKAKRIADPWRHRHPQLRLNTHRWLSSLPGLSMPRSAGSFPSRDEVVRYLDAYADRLDALIHLGVAVRRVDPDSRGWRVTTGNGVFRADHVVVATGRDRVPWMPAWSGRDAFTGELRHAADFGALERYRGRRILVVGAGNSGTDVLNHLSTIETKELWVSIRHGPVVFPTRLGGMPVQLLAPLLDRLPASVVDRALDFTERLAFGDLARWGMTRHPDGGATRLLGEGTAPAIDNGFIKALKAGRVRVVPAVKAFEGGRVRLADGAAIDPEVVVCATGYRTGLESMLGHLDVLDGRGVPAVDGAEQDPRYPGLWFIGMKPVLIGLFLAARRNAARIADAIGGESRIEPQGVPVRAEVRQDAAASSPITLR